MEKKYGLYIVDPPQYSAIIEPDIENGVNGYYIRAYS